MADGVEDREVLGGMLDQEVPHGRGGWDACARANPTHHVRLIGFDPRRQTQVVAFVVSRGEATA